MKSIQSINITLVLAIALTVLLGYNFMSAWTPPVGGTVPPANNVAAPINTGTTSQDKNGGLGVNALAVFSANPTVQFVDSNGPNFQIYGNNSILTLSAERYAGLNLPYVYDELLELSVGLTALNDFARFSGEIRADKYCDKSGNNCGFPIGVNQTWVDVTTQRAAQATYRNTTGRPIMIAISPRRNNPYFAIQVSTNGSTWLNLLVQEGDGSASGAGYIIPTGNYYRLITLNHLPLAVNTWLELR